MPMPTKSILTQVLSTTQLRELVYFYDISGPRLSKGDFITTLTHHRRLSALRIWMQLSQVNFWAEYDKAAEQKPLGPGKKGSE